MIKSIFNIWLIMAMVVFTITSVVASGGDSFERFFERNLKQSRPEIFTTASTDFAELIEKLEEKRLKVKSDESFLKYVFYAVHRKYLGEYKQYVALGEIFDKRRQYDCVTGTALYALVLDHFGFLYEIRETDYHVYLLAYAEGKKYMLESTDALYGITKDQEEIQARRKMIMDDAKKINAELAMSGVGSDEQYISELIDNKVTLKELSGLHYYNLALAELNNQNFSQAFTLVTKAYHLYPSERIKQTASLVFALAFED
ncbi:hypothetical protein [Reichenbachiella versicolor]|uniref:hypothetical protein n=1 Tax=Reichenbachiella versicolor TaxID=1821036 RepID=UPI000D6E4EE8|nr:hypothetical protein [Reichenbachiella versicolor]